MPRTNREYLLRYADQADNDMDRALERLLKMQTMYGETHPEYAKFCELVALQITTAQAQLKDFRHNHM